MAACKDMPDDLRASLKAHERVPLFIDNLAREILKVERSDHRFKGKPLTRDEIMGIVSDFTKTFIDSVKRQRDEAIMSEAAKKAIEHNDLRAREMRELADQLTEAQDEQTKETKEGFEVSRSTVEV